MEITTNLGLKCPEQNETFDVEHMNDNMRILDEIWKVIYPVGSLYISVNAASPADLFGGGTWSLVASNRVLMGTTDETKVGTTVEAGLPDVTGAFGIAYMTGGWAKTTGAFYTGAMGTPSSISDPSTSSPKDYSYGFKASRSNSIYGNSTTVQPPALLVYIWQRTA